MIKILCKVDINQKPMYLFLRPGRYQTKSDELLIKMTNRSNWRADIKKCADIINEIKDIYHIAGL